MHTLTKLRALGGIDLRNVRRDPMLALLAVFPLFIAVVYRWGVPALTTALQNRFGFDLVPYYSLLLSFVVMTMPGMVGAIIGFLLLDQRDDQTITALQVTPLTLRGYLFYRAAAPMAVSLIMTVVTLPLTGIMAAGFVALVVYALVAAPFAPIFALFTASFASNKVQGFAIMKASGVLSWPAVIAWFLPIPWQLTMGVVPHYWIAKVVWVSEAGERNMWLFVLVAAIYQLGLLWVLLRRFERVMQRE